MKAHSGMQLVRQVMEQELEPRAASAIIFEALAADRANELPSDSVALRRFVEGPLRQAAAQRLGQAASNRLVGQIVQSFAGARLAPSDANSNTLEVAVGAGPVVVLVLSRSASLAIALRAALGGDRLGVRTVSDAASVARIAPKLRPEITVVDATEPVEDDHEAIVEGLRSLPTTCTCLVWGSRERWGSRMTAALERRQIRFTPVDRVEGVDPLLDLVRSRFG
jgi:hypothetical protein